MAAFDRTVPPGEEGKIILSVDTRGYQGNIYKTARVFTNDPDIKTVTIGVRAVVDVPIHVSPRNINLFVREGRPFSRVVRIRASLEKPLSLEPERFTLDGKINYQIEEVEKGRVFKVYFKGVEGVSGKFSGYLQLKTNYPEKPMIVIRIRGRVMKKPNRSGEKA